MSLPNINRYRSLLTTYFWPQRRQVTLLVLLIIGDNILLLVGPRVLSQFVDAAVAGAASDVLVWLSIWYLIAAISQQAFTMSATYVGEKPAGKQQMRCGLTLPNIPSISICRSTKNRLRAL